MKKRLLEVCESLVLRTIDLIYMALGNDNDVAILIVISLMRDVVNKLANIIGNN